MEGKPKKVVIPCYGHSAVMKGALVHPNQVVHQLSWIQIKVPPGGMRIRLRVLKKLVFRDGLQLQDPAELIFQALFCW